MRDVRHRLRNERRVARYQRAVLDVEVARHGADAKHTVGERDARQSLDAVDVDQDLRRAETHVERGHQALPAGQHLRAFAMPREELERLGQRARAGVLEGRRFHRLIFPSARRTTRGVMGVSATLAPSGASASFTALRTAAGAPTTPDSPTPLAPSGDMRVGVSTWPQTISGISP